MSFDNSPLLVERNNAGFWCRSEMVDVAKSVFGISLVLDHGAAPVVLPANQTTEFTFASVVVPGGLLGPGGWLRVSALWELSATGNLKNIRARWAGNEITLRQTSFAGDRFLVMQRTLANRGTELAQITVNSAADFAFANSPPLVIAADTTADQVLTLTGQCAVAGDSITLHQFLVEVFPT